MTQKQNEVKELGAGAAEKQEQVNRCKQGALLQRVLHANLQLLSHLNPPSLMLEFACRAVLLDKCPIQR